jgi:DNA-binding transcriptional regulator YiaG
VTSDADEHEPEPVPGGDAWDAPAVRSLRNYLGDSQARLAARLGTRQQTISEWETGSSRPRRMSRRLLRLVAEESGFYDATGAGSQAERTDGAS